MITKKILLLACTCITAMTIESAALKTKKTVTFAASSTIHSISAASVTSVSTPPQQKKNKQKTAAVAESQHITVDEETIACNHRIYAQLVRQGNPYAQMYYLRNVLNDK